MAPFTDDVFPSLYFHYSRSSGADNLQWLTTYLTAHLREAKRIGACTGGGIADLSIHLRCWKRRRPGVVGRIKTTAPAGPLPWDETPLVGDDQGETDGQTAAGVKETQEG